MYDPTTIPREAAEAHQTPKPYVAPRLTDLGSIGAVTAGPDTDKNIDMIVGGEGGFRQADGTS